MVSFFSNEKIQLFFGSSTLLGGLSSLAGFIQAGGAIFGVIMGGILSYWMIRNAILKNQTGKLEYELLKADIEALKAKAD